MNIDSIQNGVVLDHIQAGKSMDIYKYLHLDQLDCSVAIIKNVRSGRMGKKDIIKIDSPWRWIWMSWAISTPISLSTLSATASGWQKSIWSCRKSWSTSSTAKPPLHHHGGAPAGCHFPAERRGPSHVPLRLLRDTEKGRRA